MVAKIAVVGSLNMDLIIRSPRIPQPGETILGGDFHTAPGGKGANQAVAAAKMGSEVSLIGRVGEDAFGRQLLDSLAASQVDCHSVIRDPEAATGVALIVVDDAGENCIVVASGANMRLTPSDVDASAEVIAGSQVLLLQLECPLQAVTRAAEIAKANEVTVLLNPAPARELPPELLKLVMVLIPNESETLLLTGSLTADRPNLDMAARKLLDLGVGAVVLTLGERGASLVKGTTHQSIPAFKVTPVDTTAAGDAFVGSLAVALAEGKPLEEAIHWGNAAGALATTRLGAQPSLPSRQAVEKLLAEKTVH